MKGNPVSTKQLRKVLKSNPLVNPDKRRITHMQLMDVISDEEWSELLNKENAYCGEGLKRRRIAEQRPASMVPFTSIENCPLVFPA